MKSYKTIYMPGLKKTLIQMDPVYESVSECMSLNDRIAYCKQLISETENFLQSSSVFLEEKTKDKYRKLISAARKEIDNQCRSAVIQLPLFPPDKRA